MAHRRGSFACVLRELLADAAPDVREQALQVQAEKGPEDGPAYAGAFCIAARLGLDSVDDEVLSK